MARKPDPAHRRRIIDAAWAALRESGAGSLSMAKIAEEAGIDRSTLYWHFKNRSELMWALVETVVTKQVAHVRDALIGVDDPIDRLRNYALATVGFFQNHILEINLLFRLLGKSSDSATDTILRIGRMNFAFREEMRAEFVAAQRAGLLSPDADPELVLASLRAMMDGSLIQLVTGRQNAVPVIEWFVRSTLEPLRVSSKEKAA